MGTADQDREVTAFLAAHHGVIDRRQARALGLSDSQVTRLVRTAHWQAVLPGIYARAGAPINHDSLLAAACLRMDTRAAASHRSAAWLWSLLDRAPAQPALSITGDAPAWRDSFEVHVARDLDMKRVRMRHDIPTTDPLRTLADLGAVVSERQLGDVIDRALATRLVTTEGLEAEVDRLGRRGRRGVRQLREALQRRGLAGAPDPSVLESRVLRLLRTWGITPLGAEVQVCGGRYRVDFVLRPGVVLEVDGYAYHWSPEAKAADSHRRNALRQAGFIVIEADWVTVMRQPDLLKRELLDTLASVPGHDGSTGSAPGHDGSTGSASN